MTDDSRRDPEEPTPEELEKGLRRFEEARPIPTEEPLEEDRAGAFPHAEHLLSIFDMDRTITRSGTYSPWLWHWMKARAPWRMALLPLAIFTGAGYLLKLYGRGRLKELNQALFMGRRVPAAAVAEEAERFAETIVPGKCFDEALKQLQLEVESGPRRVVLATASYEFYVHAIANRLGVEEVIGTRVHRASNGDILAKIDGENCYGAGKLRHIRSWFAERSMERKDTHIRFFSDHPSDEPTFAWADEAFAINGDDKLQRLTQRHGWTHYKWGEEKA